MASRRRTQDGTATTSQTTRPSRRQERLDAGVAVLRKLDGGGDRRALRALLAEIAPDFNDLTLEVAYGGFWSRPALDLASRELATVAALCALGRERQLAAHLRSALNAGVGRDQLVEVLMQMAIYAGWPAAVNGLLVARDVFASLSSKRLSLGGTTLTVVSDGHAELPAPFFAGGVGNSRIGALLARHDLPAETVRLSLNGLVLEHEGHLVVIDPGSGPADGPHAHGLVAPTQGHLLDNLGRAGFSAEDVDLVILTHGHHDHAAAALGVDGGLTFRNARIAMSEAEFRHWREVGDYGEATATVPPLLATAARDVGRALTGAIADRVIFLEDGHEILPGLRAVAAPGHTCGQIALILETTDGDLLIGGDFATHELIQLAEPASHMIVDYDGAQAVASRRGLLDRAVHERLLVHAFHFTWPGIGRVQQVGERWHFIPLGAELAETDASNVAAGA
jgi:alkylhydroperoxidase/carboxymuconolactone decarboxylase family protein YurZ/glyoxylase-like metal-dependent hydrolase (beta-lactamase superfamily II)